MPHVFLYGTLRDDILRDRILGAPVGIVAATFMDHSVLRQEQGPLPYLAAAKGQVADGLLALDVSDDQLDRLNAYEAAFDYHVEDIVVNADGKKLPAMAYLPSTRVVASQASWSLEEWVATLGPVSREAAREIGSYDPPLAADALRRQWGMIETRAAGRVRAATHPAPAALRYAPKEGDVTVLSQGPLWGDFFKAGQINLRHRTFQGTISPDLTRECFHGTDAAIVLPYDAKSDNVLLVEQIRMGPLVRGAANPWSLEPIAGMVDGRETPEDAARREAEEEAGLQGVTLEKMFAFYASPGNSTDYFTCYAGLCDLPEPRSYTGGLDTEHEDLRLHIIPFQQAFDLISTGEANVGPLVTMLLWLDRNRTRLRGTA